MNTISSGLLFLIGSLFDLYLFILAIRVLLVYNQTNYFDLISQFIIKLTQPLIKPFRRYINNVRNIELTTVMWIYILELIKIAILSSATIGYLSVVGLIYFAFSASIKLFLNTFFYAILIQAILSFVQPYSPATQLLGKITAPILRPFQRLIPPIGGFDISPIPALLILQTLTIMIP